MLGEKRGFLLPSPKPPPVFNVFLEKGGKGKAERRLFVRGKWLWGRQRAWSHRRGGSPTVHTETNWSSPPPLGGRGVEMQ